MTSAPVTLPILAARAIVAGDVHVAHALILEAREARPIFTVAEQRALAGACAYANRYFSADLDWRWYVLGDGRE
jgi:hypothetical protein